VDDELAHTVRMVLEIRTAGGYQGEHLGLDAQLRACEQIGAGTQEPRKKELLKPP
jgi:hypothetical protein